MNCPKCKSEERVKNGIVKGRQRYKCMDCSYNYTVEKRSGEYSDEIKKNALHLYLEGLGFRSIGRYLNVSNVAVLNWIKHFGVKEKEIQSEVNPVKYVEIDEMHSYIGSKKTAVGYGLLLVDLGSDSSISLLATEAKRQGKSYGKKSKILK